MKQSLFMLLTLIVGVPAGLVSPFAGLAIYYGLELLRPQFLWRHSLQFNWRFSLIIGLATVAGYILKGCAGRTPGRRWPVEKVLLGIVAILTVGSYLNSIDPPAAAERFSEYAKVFFMFFIACGLLTTRKRLRILSLVIVIALGWVAFDFNQRYVLMGQTHIATYGFDGQDNNGLAAIMVMAMPFCMLLFSQEKKWYLKYLPLGALLLMLHVVLFSMSRGGMLAVIVIAPLMLLRLRRRWVGVALAIVLVAAGLRLAGSEVRQRFFSIDQYQADESAQGRLIAWRVAGEVMRDYPLLGVGPRCFRHVAARYESTLENRTVHNQILETGAEMGIAAMLAYVAIILFALFHLRQMRIRYRRDPFVFDLAGCLQTSIIGFLAASLFLSLGTMEFQYIIIAMVVGLRNVLAEEAAPQAAVVATRVSPAPSLPPCLDPATT